MTAKTTAKTDLFTQLPTVSSLQAFSFLEASDLAKTSALNKLCNRMACHDQLWRAILKEIELPIKKDLKKYFTVYAITSRKDLLEKIQKFTSKIPMNIQGQFVCLFPYNPGCSVTANLEFALAGTPPRPAHKELFLFIKPLPRTDHQSLSDRKCQSGPYGAFFSTIESKLTLPKGKEGENLDLENEIKRLQHAHLQILNRQRLARAAFDLIDQEKRKKFMRNCSISTVIVIAAVALHFFFRK